MKMLVTREFNHQGQIVVPGDVIDSPQSEAVYLRLANLAEPSAGEPNPDVDQIDAASWMADYATQLIELQHKYLVVRGFLNG